MHAYAYLRSGAAYSVTDMITFARSQRLFFSCRGTGS